MTPNQDSRGLLSLSRRDVSRKTYLLHSTQTFTVIGRRCHVAYSGQEPSLPTVYRAILLLYHDEINCDCCINGHFHSHLLVFTNTAWQCFHEHAPNNDYALSVLLLPCKKT